MTPSSVCRLVLWIGLLVFVVGGCAKEEEPLTPAGPAVVRKKVAPKTPKEVATVEPSPAKVVKRVTAEPEKPADKVQPPPAVPVAKAVPPPVEPVAPGPGIAAPEAAEKELSERFRETSRDVEKKIEKNDFGGALSILASLRNAVDKFFDEVLVMAPEKDIMKNRLAMLKNIVDLFSPVGDISKLTPAEFEG